MQYRLRFPVFLASLIIVLCSAPAGTALEKTSVRFTDEPREDWNRASTSCQVAYYNLCNGWIWVWSGWDAGDTFGVWFSGCCPGGFGTRSLLDTFLFFQQEAPSGYGFTGTLDVWNADGQGCPVAPPLRSTPFLPTSNWNQVSFAGSPVDVSAGDFVITVTTGNYTIGNPSGIASDHPAAGSTGPAACGLCYPTTRATRSFYYGSSSGPFLCPGSPLFDNVCNAELLWDVDIRCSTTAVDGRSWGQIKKLYR
jgi:hypothetical protein